jgi:hypothetical protein
MSGSDSVQGALPLLVLKILSRRGPLHGYGIMTRIEEISEEMLSVEEGNNCGRPQAIEGNRRTLASRHGGGRPGFAKSLGAETLE